MPISLSDAMGMIGNVPEAVAAGETAMRPPQSAGSSIGAQIRQIQVERNANRFLGLDNKKIYHIKILLRKLLVLELFKVLEL
jgi:hypothetical protein